MRLRTIAPVPPENDEAALWRLLRDAMEEPPGFSIRRLARELAGPDATQNQVESQRRKIHKWLDEKKPAIPSAREARKLAAALGKPEDYFVRPQERKTARERELEAEMDLLQSSLDRVLAENAELRRRLEDESRSTGD